MTWGGVVFSPANQVRLARSYWKWDQREAARELAQLASDGFRKIHMRGDLLAAQDYLHWLAAEELLGRPVDGIDIMRLALIAHPDDRDLNSQAEKVVLRFLDDAWAPTDLQLWIRAANQSLQFQPALEAAHLNIVARASSDPQLAARVRDMFEPLIVENHTSARVAQLVADLSMVSRDYDRARHDYRRILERDETNSTATNNLAWIYGNIPPIDLAEALQLSSAAVNNEPDNASLRETRAQILLKLKRWRDAAADLEFALNGLPDYHPIHDGLAECYDHLSQPELAAAHRERSRALQVESEAN